MVDPSMLMLLVLEIMLEEETEVDKVDMVEDQVVMVEDKEDSVEDREASATTMPIDQLL